MEATNEPVENELVPVPDFPGYFVTRNGQVWSRRQHEPTQLKQSLVTSHRTVGMMTTITVYKYVHEVVLTTFAGPCPEGYRFKFLDGDKTNLCVDNLAWVPAVGRKRGSPKKLTRQDVLAIRKASEGGEVQANLALKFGVSQPTISSIIARKSWRHLE